MFIGGGILARRNLRLGYGDTRGGRRLAIWIASGGILWPVLRAHHVPLVVDEWIFLLIATGWALVWTAFAWLIYISLEPYVRRWWPHTLISWARLLSGRVRDPLVGRDLLAGLLAGIGLVALLIARVEVSRRLGVIVSPLDQAYSLEALRLVPYFGLIVYFGIDVLNFALAMLGTLLLIRVIVRNQRAQRGHLGVERGDAQSGRRRDALGSGVRGRAGGLCRLRAPPLRSVLDGGDAASSRT